MMEERLEELQQLDNLVQYGPQNAKSNITIFGAIPVMLGSSNLITLILGVNNVKTNQSKLYI